VLVVYVLFTLSLITIFWAMIGYDLSLRLIYPIFKNRSKISKNQDIKARNTSVTLMIVAHNEEKVIKQKLQNAISIKYPKNLMEILVTSDNSTDRTNEIVLEFIKGNPNENIRLFKVSERKGKTNAQNEAQKTVKSEILVMTDANSMFEENAVMELVDYFDKDNIAYVCGQLKYINKDDSPASASEVTYWSKELKTRYIESELKSIVSGNGAIYACRNNLYKDFDPIESHDSAMPKYYVLNKMKALYNPNAIAYEKAGESFEDEFKRKVRMNRNIVKNLIPPLKVLNIFKYGWYTYVYLGHKTARSNLGIAHIVLLVTNIIISINNIYFIPILFLHILFYLFALTGRKIKFILFRLPYYYALTIYAQIVGIYNGITGKSKPFWEKAESTR